MQVLCINAGKVKSKGGQIYDATGILVEGNIYTVINTVTSKLGENGYVLLEIQSIGLKGSFNEIRFIPTSKINEENLYQQILHQKH